MGANIFKDVFAGIRDIVGGRSATYERELRRARDIAMEEIKTAAAEMGANAVVAVDIDYETVGGNASMLMVTISGTEIGRASWRQRVTSAANTPAATTTTGSNTSSVS